MNTVYEQQLEFLHTDLTAAFQEDLAQAIVEWKNEGDQLIIMGDWNEVIVNGNLTDWMKTFGLSEAIMDIHGPNPLQRLREEQMQLTASLLARL